jgi:hypothetical protein
VNRFAAWLSQTSPSLAIQNHEWVIPTIQSIHIAAIGIVLGSVLMMVLRILGWAGRDQSVRQTAARFGPWLSGALIVLLVTGAAMVIGEPARELLSFSFWSKMSLIAIGTVIVSVFRRSLRERESQWEGALVHRQSIKTLAVVTLLIWMCVVVLGRLIAYDYVWGSWSKVLKE